MPTSPPRNPIATALWANAALLAVVAAVLIFRAPANNFPSLLPAAYGQSQNFTPPIAGGGGVFIMPAQFSRDAWGVYLLDIDAQTLVAYQYFPGRGDQPVLKLVAARTYRYDRRLQNFNTGTPTPEEVRELVDRESRLRTNTPPTTQP